MAAIPVGKKAPQFTLPSLDGSVLASEAPTGGVTVLTFYKETCPTCQLAMPFVDNLYRHHRDDKKVRFVAVAQEDKEGAARFRDQYKMTIPTALDSKPYSVSTQYGLTNVPTMFVVGADGVIENMSVGFMKKDLECLAARLATLTGKSTAPLFERVTVPDYKPG